MRFRSLVPSLLAAALASPFAAQAGAITSFAEVVDFDAAAGALAITVEDFTPTSHFPISSGILNSATNEAGITPGTIEPGVTYSTPIGVGNFFNIDFGGGFDGGFLDTVTGRRQVLTVIFDSLTQFFGFDTNYLVGGGMDLKISFDDGSTSLQTVTPGKGSGMDFFGFGSAAADIKAVTFSGDNPAFSFALDNFRFTTGGSNPVPEPGTAALGGLALLALGLTRRRRNAS